MIRAVTSGGREFALKLREAGPRVVESVERKMLRIVIGLQRYVILNKLEGNPLHHRTGNLERNIVYEVESDGGIVEGTVGVGRGAPYGKVHELGGAVQVPEHHRTSKLGKGFSVRSHLANYPQRAFLRPSLYENAADIEKQIQQAVNEAL